MLALIIWGGLTADSWRHPTAESDADHPRITLQTLRRSAELLVARVPVQQVVHTRLQGRAGGIHCVLLAHGEVMIAADLDQASLTIDRSSSEARSATLYLPAPRVLTGRIDHEATRVVLAQRSGLWLALPGDAGEAAVIERALSQAQHALTRAVQQEHLLQARQHTESVARDLFTQQGWQVRVVWQEP